MLVASRHLAFFNLYSFQKIDYFIYYIQDIIIDKIIGNMALLEIIQNKNVPKVILRYIMMNFLDLSSIRNVVSNVKYMSVLDAYSKTFLEKATQGFFWNCVRGHLDVAKWLYKKGIDYNRDNVSTFYDACRNGHLDVAQWLHSLIDKTMKVTGGEKLFVVYGYNSMHIDFDLERIFFQACYYGHIDVAKWLYSLNNTIITNYFYPSTGEYKSRTNFIDACSRGYFDLAKWLVSMGEPEVDIHEYNEKAFRHACLGGHLDIAQWLWSIGQSTNKPINIHIKEECAFRYACLFGSLDVAKWLHTLGDINIHAKNDKAFRIACIGRREQSYLDVAKWLHSLGGVNVCAYYDEIFKLSDHNVKKWLKVIRKKQLFKLCVQKSRKWKKQNRTKKKQKLYKKLDIK